MTNEILGYIGSSSFFLHSFVNPVEQQVKHLKFTNETISNDASAFVT